MYVPSGPVLDVLKVFTGSVPFSGMTPIAAAPMFAELLLNASLTALMLPSSWYAAEAGHTN